MEKIKQYVKDNLPELAAEIIDWKLSTAILYDSKLRMLDKMIHEHMGANFDGLKIAETMVNRAPLEFVVRHHEGAK